ncbi:MAG: 50S ribosomal protein L22, partial [Candidatus Woesearchaeota archaeon]
NKELSELVCEVKMKYRYATKVENCAKAVGISLPVSTKKAVEICNMIRGKKVEVAATMLQQVIEKKRAVPIRRFARGGTGHRKKMGPGRYPEKSCGQILALLNTAIANAQVKGLSNLIIKGICAQRAAKSFHFGRKRRRKMKRAHIEIVLTEISKKQTPEQKK